MAPSEIIKKTKVLLIGAGPTGLGAAVRLTDLNETEWLVLERSNAVGGLSITDKTDEGFLFDVGGHVLFSHYQYFDECLARALPKSDDWYHHQRISYIRSRGKWVPYPFQNNIAMLPEQDKIECMNGLIDAALKANTYTSKPRNFDEWILRTLGNGIADVFMRQYNFKVWAIPTTEMSASWLGERVAAPDLKAVTTNLIKNVPAGNWGPNATFRFPAFGGTGGIWEAVAKRLPREKIALSSEVLSIDADEKAVTYNNSDGTTTIVQYEKLITTMPLDILVSVLKTSKYQKSELEMAANKLIYSNTNIIGIGVRGQPMPHVGDKCWLYFPEDDCPFYRATIFSNYSPNNCPPPTALLPTIRLAGDKEKRSAIPTTGPYFSLMFEVSESPYKPVDTNKVIEETIQGAINFELLRPEDEIVSIYYKRFEHGYPTPSIERDAGLEVLLPKLQSLGIWSRGRFGAWKYEVGNQDHSFMQGVEAADSALYGTPEMTISNPDWTNSRRNLERSSL